MFNFGSAQWKTGNEMITGFLDGNSFDVRAEAAGFVRHDRADAVHRVFIG
jgi:hypothetical protein